MSEITGLKKPTIVVSKIKGMPFIFITLATLRKTGVNEACFHSHSKLKWLYKNPIVATYMEKEFQVFVQKDVNGELVDCIVSQFVEDSL